MNGAVHRLPVATTHATRRAVFKFQIRKQSNSPPPPPPPPPVVAPFISSVSFFPRARSGQQQRIRCFIELFSSSRNTFPFLVRGFFISLVACSVQNSRPLSFSADMRSALERAGFMQ